MPQVTGYEKLELSTVSDGNLYDVPINRNTKLVSNTGIRKYCSTRYLVVWAVIVILVITATTCFALLAGRHSSNEDDDIKVGTMQAGLYGELTQADGPCNTTKRDCLDLYLNGCRRDGVYKIDPTQTGRTIRAFCDMTFNGGGWTVIQRREDDSINFYRDFGEFVNGFGKLRGNMWLGLDAIHDLTTNTGDITELYVYFESFDNENRFAKYSEFYIDGALETYKLHVSGYYGTAGDSMTYHNNRFFSAYDNDNDAFSGNCAKVAKGGWWYNACVRSNLNGLYLLGQYPSGYHGIVWEHWKGFKYSLKRTIMKIRRHSNLVGPSRK